MYENKDQLPRPGFNSFKLMKLERGIFNRDEYNKNKPANEIAVKFCKNAVKFYKIAVVLPKML